MVRTDIEARGVNNTRVLAALRSTERHLFVPVSLRSSAYADHPLPIGHGQTISQPYIVGLMTELLDVSAEHRVLEIGTGSGYQAAVLAPLAREVFSIEIVGPLAAEASAIIGKLGLKNVTIRNGDGYKGWPEKAPFDRIIVTAAPPEIPPVLIEQLKAGGKMVVPVGAQGQAQELLLIEKSADGKIRRRSTIPVLFVPMVKGK
jgi:protein-L-isoaspartate(D-aspartate) O-methyltransferase